MGTSVNDYHFGGLIAKGCSAAVYRAALIDSSANSTGIVVLLLCNIMYVFFYC